MDKLVTGLKDIPLWGLAALAIALVIVQGAPHLQAGLPAGARPAVPLACALLLILTGCAAIARLGAVVLSARSREAARGREQLLNLYRPIMNLFLDRHVTVCRAIGAPRLADRVRRAGDVLKKPGSLWSRLGGAWIALRDRRVSTASEVEFGGEFPLREIAAIAKAHPAEADPLLLGLVSQANRSRCETPVGPGEMTDEDLALYEFVKTRHARLSRLT